MKTIDLHELDDKCDYFKWCYYSRRHRRRYINRVENTNDSLPCQDCRGSGGYTEPVLDDGSGPFYECGWCYGTLKTTKWVRGAWLRYRKEMKLS